MCSASPPRSNALVSAENVARISDGGSGPSAATVRLRLAAVSAFYGYIGRGDVGVDVNPVPRGLPTRRSATWSRPSPVPQRRGTARHRRRPSTLFGGV
jgi:hypothetical protein